MAHARRVIFRDKALKYYTRGQEENVLPHFISPPVMLFLWCLLVLVLVSGIITYFWHIPIYVTGLGEVSTQTQQTCIVVVVPADQLSYMHPGLPVQLHIGLHGPQWQQTITEVEPSVMSPIEVRDRFGLDNAAALLVTQPSAIVLVQINHHLLGALYAGSLVQVQIQVGSQRVISLFPGLGWLEGE